MNLSELETLANIMMPLITLLVGAGQIAVVWWGIREMVKSNQNRAITAKEDREEEKKRHQEATDQANQRHQEAMAQASQRHKEVMAQASQRHQEAMAQASQRHQEAMERMEKQHHETMEQLRQQDVILKALIERNK